MRWMFLYILISYSTLANQGLQMFSIYGIHGMEYIITTFNTALRGQYIHPVPTLFPAMTDNIIAHRIKAANGLALYYCQMHFVLT